MAEKLTQQAAQQLTIPFVEILASLKLSPELAKILTKPGLLLNLATNALENSLEIVWPKIRSDALFFAVIFQFIEQVSSKLSTIDRHLCSR